jgi:hypothetical protein
MLLPSLDFGMAAPSATAKIAERAKMENFMIDEVVVIVVLRPEGSKKVDSENAQ